MVDSRGDRSRTLARTIGGKVAQRRKELGWTQDALAERIGVDAETVSRIERGANLPSVVTLDRFAETLRCSVADFLDAEPTGRQDVELVDAWLNGLSDEDRGFALDSLRSLCDHLRKY